MNLASTPPAPLTSATPSAIVPPKTEPRPQANPPGARVALSRVFGAGVAALAVLGRSRWADPDTLLPELMMVAGLTLATMAMAGRMWCSLFIAGRKNLVVTRHGPYALCRHPLYFFSLIGAVGVGMATGMFMVALTVGLGFALYYPAVIRREEAFLRQRHGDAYTAYMQTVPCFWPRWQSGPKVHPASMTCHPRLFTRHLASAVWFPIACGLAHALGQLKSDQLDWPAWFTLP